MPGGSDKRRRIVIDPGFQIKLAMLWSVAAAVEVVVAGVAIMAVALGSGPTAATAPAGTIYRLAFTVGVLAVGLTAINFLVAVRLSHRIAGPVYRLRESMKQVGAGDLSLLIHLRVKDELQETKDEFNDMVSQLREKVKALKKELPAKAQEKLERIFKID
jgi:methyl-accepting chemotaxis protein